MIEIGRDPCHIVGYRGYGSADRVLVLGRVLENERIAPADPSHSWWRNLIDTLKRVESDPLPYARVRARVHGTEREIVADDEGFLREWLTLPTPLSAPGWHAVELALSQPSRSGVATTAAPVLNPPPTASFGVVSDMDDTVLQSEVTSFIRAAKLMLLENSRTRLPFAGVAAFYRALQAGSATGNGDANPIFYVSSSPWNLYDVIADFLTAQEIPTGPLLLRDWDLGRSTHRHAAHKSAHIREILATYPSLPFIFVGDSGQEDPEIYSAIVREHPERILAVYIRNVTPHPERSAAIQKLAGGVRESGSSLVLADDTLAVARHAAAHGWIAAGTLAEIGAEKRADEGTSDAKVATPGVTTEPPTATVVVNDTIPPRELG